MALKDDIKEIEDACSVARVILFLNAQPSFKVEGLDLIITKTQIPRVLTDRLTADLNSALATIKTKAAALPNSV
jgi:bacterioferritin (cytochrome b1)